jgi:ABC-type transport system involved in multi-copper enzyme maturation permease subunit
MKQGLVAGLQDHIGLLRLSIRVVGGRRFWLAPLFPLPWLVFQYLIGLFGQRETFNSMDAQNLLIGAPLAALAVGFGVRIIAGEIDRRILEIAYTVPGGTHRVWLAKLEAAAVILLVTEALLALVTYFFFTDFPLVALYGAFQAAIFYLVLSMGLAALFKSEAAGALVTALFLAFNLVIQSGNVRVSPFFNPERELQSAPADVLALIIQNRIGYLLFISAVTLLAFRRAERREKLLS